MIPRNIMIDNDSIKAIATKLYGISEPCDCKFIRRSFNDHYLLQTKNEKYIMRVYLNNKYYIKDMDDFKFELELLTFLASKNVQVSYPIRNRDNKLISNFLYNNETRLIALFSFAEGNPIGTSIDHNLAIRFGEIIANLHKVSNEFKSNHYRYNVNLNYLINEPVQTLQEYADKYTLGELNFFMPYADYLTNQLKELPVNSESHGIIHGDLNPSNIHLDSNGNLTLIDFDHCAFGWRIHDLAVMKLCYNKCTYEGILEGYASNRNLSETEERLIELYAKALIIRKYKDILSMLQISDNDISKSFNEKEFIRNSIDTLHSIVES